MANKVGQFLTVYKEIVEVLLSKLYLYKITDFWMALSNFVSLRLIMYLFGLGK